MKPKILEFNSIEYGKGRVDSFRIDESQGNWESIISCLIDLGFEDNSEFRADIDFALEDRSYLFQYLHPTIRLHLLPEKEKDAFFVRLDTSLPKERIYSVFERYFEFPN